MESSRTRTGLQRTVTAFFLCSMATKLALALALEFVVSGMRQLGSAAVIGSGRLLSIYVFVPVLRKGAVFIMR
jgi:hypothetical protein